jgi:hypothetical protein
LGAESFEQPRGVHPVGTEGRWGHSR